MIWGNVSRFVIFRPFLSGFSFQERLWNSKDSKRCKERILRKFSQKLLKKVLKSREKIDKKNIYVIIERV